MMTTGFDVEEKLGQLTSVYEGLLGDAKDLHAACLEADCKREAKRNIRRCIHGLPRNEGVLEMLTEWQQRGLGSKDRVDKLIALVRAVDAEEKAALADAKVVLAKVPEVEPMAYLVDESRIEEFLCVLDGVCFDLSDVMEALLLGVGCAGDRMTDLELDEYQWQCEDVRDMFQLDLKQVREWRECDGSDDLAAAERGLVDILGRVDELFSLIEGARGKTSDLVLAEIMAAGKTVN